MIAWLQTYAKTHIFYLVLIAVGFVAFRSWLQEHDARVNTEQAVRFAEFQIHDLQGQIVAAKQQAAQKVQVVTKVVHDVTTPEQAVAAIPLLTDVPLGPRIAVDNLSQLSVNALPLITVLGQARIDKTNLDTCQQVSGLKDQQLTVKDVEIAALKKKPSFWKRALGTAKIVVVSVAAGMIVHAVM